MVMGDTYRSSLQTDSRPNSAVLVRGSTTIPDVVGWELLEDSSQGISATQPTASEQRNIQCRTIF